MAPADVWLHIEGYQLRERAEYERLRILAFTIARGYADPSKMAKTAERFMPFPWDKKKKVQTLSNEEIRARHAQMKAEREKLINGKEF
jgi:hypothetical protein